MDDGGLDEAWKECQNWPLTEATFLGRVPKGSTISELEINDKMGMGFINDFFWVWGKDLVQNVEQNF